jgi:hypothetical protein
VGLDFAWVACDGVGAVAVFTNGGNGPIPAALPADRPFADRVEALLRELPWVGGHTLHVGLPRPDDYIGWAERGLFAYDWRDAGRYEILATPECPIPIGRLPPHLARPAGRSVLGRLRFAGSPALYPVDLGECAW